jgi:hypothetical protein
MGFVFLAADGFLEIADALAQGFAQVGELSGPENDDDDDQDEEQLLGSDWSE